MTHLGNHRLSLDHDIKMARISPFIGGLLIVTTITYLNFTTVIVVAKDIQAALLREQKKLDEAATAARQRNTDRAAARAADRANGDSKTVGDLVKWPTARIADRAKKIWNEDIEKSVRRMQDTDWVGMGRAVEGHVKKARERMITSFEKISDNSKKGDA
jgi:Altered inheritance of mitochondria 5